MRACCSGVAPVLLTLWGGRAAQQNRDLLLRAQRALKEGVVIRKRQGEPFWFPLLLCARRPRRPHFPVKRGHIRCPFSRNAPIGRAMRAPTGCDHRTACSPACHRQKEENPIGSPSSCARGGRAGRIPPRRARTYVAPFSRNAPIGRAMRARRDASSKQHASRKPKKRRTPSGSPLFYLPLTYSM